MTGFTRGQILEAEQLNAMLASPPVGTAGGDLAGTYPNPTLTTTGVTPAVYGDATHVAVITIDSKGRITTATSTAISGAAPTGAAGGGLSGTYPNPTVSAVPASGLPALTGDVTSSVGSAATTLTAGSASSLNSGTLAAARLPAMTGDVTASAGSHATTLAAGSAGNLNSGTLLAARMPALTGDVTSSAGGVATTLAAGNAGNLNSGTLAAARGGTGVSNSNTITLGGNFITSGSFAATLTLTGSTNVTLPTSGALGFRNLPQNIQSAAYTTVLGDSGGHILHPSADTTARTWTIDSNANVPYPLGTAITFVNQISGGVITIAITSDTMWLAGAGTTGNRSLAANGVATALKITTTGWIISGTGLT